MTGRAGGLSRWAERFGVDRSDAVFAAGALLVGVGLGWAVHPAWGLCAVGCLVVLGYLLQFLAALAAGRKGGEG